MEDLATEEVSTYFTDSKPLPHARCYDKLPVLKRMKSVMATIGPKLL